MTETIASKLAFRDAFPPATLRCILQVEEDTGEQAALRDVGADGLPLDARIPGGAARRECAEQRRRAA